MTPRLIKADIRYTLERLAIVLTLVSLIFGACKKGDSSLSQLNQKVIVGTEVVPLRFVRWDSGNPIGSNPYAMAIFEGDNITLSMQFPGDKPEATRRYKLLDIPTGTDEMYISATKGSANYKPSLLVNPIQFLDVTVSGNQINFKADSIKLFYDDIFGFDKNTVFVFNLVDK